MVFIHLHSISKDVMLNATLELNVARYSSIIAARQWYTVPLSCVLQKQ